VKIKEILILSLCLFSSQNAQPLNSAQINQKRKLFRFSSPALTDSTIITSPTALLGVSKDMLRYFKAKHSSVDSPILGTKLISPKEAEETLKFIIRTIEEDQKNGSKNFRIQNTKFIKENFSFIKWNGDRQQAAKDKVFIPKWPDGGRLAPGKIKLTGYAVFRCNGSYRKTKKFPCAVYKIKNNILEKMIDTNRNRFTKQNILAGLFEKPPYRQYVKPLAWLSRKSFEEATMQGSAIAKMPDNKHKILNVHKSNGFTYNKKSKALEEIWAQPKYWFFNEIHNVNGSRGRNHLKIIKHGGVAFAGDYKNIGLGKVILLNYTNPISRKNEILIGILADQGSAFSNNLYQLDLFTGIFDNRSQFREYIRRYPNTVNAYILKRST